MSIHYSAGVGKVPAPKRQFITGREAFVRLQTTIAALRVKEEECQLLEAALAEEKAARQQDHERISILEDEIETLRSDLASAQETLARRRETDALLFNHRRSAHTPSEKVVVADVFAQLEREGAEKRDGHVYYNQQTAAKRLKMSENTIGVALQTLIANGELAKISETRERKGQEGQTYPATFLKPVPEKLRTVWTQPKEELKAERIKRYGPCKACHSSEHLTLVKRTELHCACGHVELLNQDVHLLKPEETVQEADRKNCDVLNKNTPPHTTDDVPASDHPAEGDLKFCDQGGQADLQRTDHQEPAAPIVQQSDDAALLWAASLLQYSPCGTHIFMPPDGPDKYKEPTPKHDITQAEALEHFRGGLPRGFKKQPGVKWIRWLIFDVDDPDGCALLVRCGQMLVAAGWKAMIEHSPSAQHAGGVHLVILFSALVDARSAYEQAYQIAPELRSIKEVWPFTTNMRAPGARFKRPAVYHKDTGALLFPAVDGWCLLKSLDTGDVAQNGTEAAHLLFANQTDALLIPDLPMPAPEPSAPKPQPTPERPKPATIAQMSGGMGGAWIPDMDYAREIIDAFCARFTLDDIYPRVTRDKAYALDRPNENEPSLHYNDAPLPGYDKTIAKDFGQGASKGCYDAFELEVQVNWHGDKSAALRHWKKQLTGDILARRQRAS